MIGDEMKLELEEKEEVVEVEKPKEEKKNIKLCYALSKILCDSTLHPRFGHDPVYFKAVSDEIDNLFEDYL